MIYFGAQNDTEIVPLRPIFNTPLKVVQIDMYTKTDAKPVENFWENDQRPEIFTYLRTQSGPKIGYLRLIFYTFLKVAPMSIFLKHDWCESRGNFVT